MNKTSCEHCMSHWHIQTTRANRLSFHILQVHILQRGSHGLKSIVRDLKMVQCGVIGHFIGTLTIESDLEKRDQSFPIFPSLGLPFSPVTYTSKADLLQLKELAL
jgi:hypothetical protein